MQTVSIPISKNDSRQPVAYNKLNLLLHRWLHWEYWPMWLANIPVVLMYLWFAMRARRWFFFSAANPGLPLGGAFGVSKYDILQRIPQELVPAMLLVQPNTPFDEVMARVREAGMEFPLIAKPDMGERGYLVQKIDKPGELQSYLYEW